MTQIILKWRQNAAKYHILILGNFGVFSFLRSWKLTRFLTTCISVTSFKIWTFSAFLNTRTTFFQISSHNLHNNNNNKLITSRALFYIHWSTALNNLKNYDKIQICKTNYMYMNINNVY